MSFTDYLGRKITEDKKETCFKYCNYYNELKGCDYRYLEKGEEIETRAIPVKIGKDICIRFQKDSVVKDFFELFQI